MIAAWFVPWQLAVLISWDVTAIVVVVRAWSNLWWSTADETRADETRADEVLIEVIGIVTILLSWIVVHTTLAPRYAHVYYAEPIGGISFKSTDGDPDDRDFAYLAFTVGMTYQVADTDVTNRTMRHVILRHALLSFVFGSVILATTVNLIANLLNR